MTVVARETDHKIFLGMGDDKYSKYSTKCSSSNDDDAKLLPFFSLSFFHFKRLLMSPHPVVCIASLLPEKVRQLVASPTSGPGPGRSRHLFPVMPPQNHRERKTHSTRKWRRSNVTHIRLHLGPPAQRISCRFFFREVFFLPPL